LPSKRTKSASETEISFEEEKAVDEHSLDYESNRFELDIS